jgi:hypothetical protein
MSGTSAIWRSEREVLGVETLETDVVVETGVSALSWAAIIGGAVAATAATVVLVIVGSGFGLTWVSPWGGNPSMTSFAMGAAIWLIVVQWISALVGGFITGRLRVRWAGLHTHEVFFRDTAHGFLAWALSTLLVVALVAITSSAFIGGGTRQAVQRGADAAQAATHDYNRDLLFRSAPGSEARASDPEARAEAGRILQRAAATSQTPDADRVWLAQLVASRTGLSSTDAGKRADDVIAREVSDAERARAAADEARKAVARASIMTGIAMLVGAFIASAAAAFGGSMRDEYP